MTNDSFRPEARAPKGFGDRRADEIAAERAIVEAVSGVYERYGFEPLATSAFEYADALGKFLPDSERPNAGVFALQDDDEQWMALRYDLTAPLARFAAENWQTLPKPFRRYAVGTVWRNEKVGPGRFREFTQCDADTVGSARPEADAEIIAMAAEGLVAAGLQPGQALIKINSRKLLDGLMGAQGVAEGQKLTVLRALDKFDRLGWEGVTDLLGGGRLDESGDFTKGAGLDPGQIAAFQAFMEAASRDLSRGKMLDALSDLPLGEEGAAGVADLAAIDAALTSMGVGEAAARLDPSVVRGLEYYTGAVFEAELLLSTTDEKGNAVRFGSIGGGGRYDGLVARFTGEAVPATGFSFGVSRLASALRAAGRERPAARGPVVVIAFDQAMMSDYFAAASELRRAGIAAEVYLGSSGMRPQMKYADRRLSPAAVIIGEDEKANGTVTIKDLDLGRELAAGVKDSETWRAERPGQQTAPRAQLVPAIQAILDAAK